MVFLDARGPGVSRFCAMAMAARAAPCLANLSGSRSAPPAGNAFFLRWSGISRYGSWPTEMRTCGGFGVAPSLTSQIINGKGNLNHVWPKERPPAAAANQVESS